MLNSVLFGTYCFSIGAIVYNLTRIKAQNDYEQEIKDYREYEFENEKLRKEQFEKEVKCIILGKHMEYPIKEPQDESKPSSKFKVLFQKDIAIFNVLDPARYFSAKIKPDE